MANSKFDLERLNVLDLFVISGDKLLLIYTDIGDKQRQKKRGKNDTKEAKRGTSHRVKRERDERKENCVRKTGGIDAQASGQTKQREKKIEIENKKGEKSKVRIKKNRQREEREKQKNKAVRTSARPYATNTEFKDCRR